MTKKNIQYCSLVGLGSTTVLWAQGWCGFHNVTGSRVLRGRRCHRLREDDGTAGPGTVWVYDVASSGMTLGIQHHGLGEDNILAGLGMALRAW
jgi:hypothetical protein